MNLHTNNHVHASMNRVQIPVENVDTVTNNSCNVIAMTEVNPAGVSQNAPNKLTQLYVTLSTNHFATEALIK